MQHTELENCIEVVVKRLKSSHCTLALTGAGVSTDSGVPDFRSKNGLYSKVSPEIFNIEFFYRNPEEFYRINLPFIETFRQTKPNITHEVLAEMESRDLLKAVITQNIDGLHEKAGSRHVLNCHGSYATFHCLQCRKAWQLDDFLCWYREHLHVCSCGGSIKPDVVLFGEPLTDDFEEAADLVDKCDFLMILGSSLVVYPVAGLAEQAVGKGVPVMIINRDPVPLGRMADNYQGSLSEFSSLLRTRLLEVFSV